MAYKALQLGIQRLANNRISIPDNLHADIGLLISLLRIDGVEIDGRILSTYEAGGYSAATATEAAFNSTEQQNNAPPTPLPSAEGETVEAPSANWSCRLCFRSFRVPFPTSFRLCVTAACRAPLRGD